MTQPLKMLDPKNSECLVIDTGQNIIGIFDVWDECYQPYYGKDEMRIAAIRAFQAELLITYNGNQYDILQVIDILSLPSDTPFPKSGAHLDIREVIWGRIQGSSLKDTYLRYYQELPSTPMEDSYIASNYLDCIMTYKLWKLKAAEGFLSSVYQ